MDLGEYEDPNYLKKLNSLINAKNPNTDVSTPIMDLVEQPPVEPADELVDEADEPDHLQVPAAEVRMRVMEAIIAPITSARLLDSHRVRIFSSGISHLTICRSKMAHTFAPTALASSIGGFPRALPITACSRGLRLATITRGTGTLSCLHVPSYLHPFQERDALGMAGYGTWHVHRRDQHEIQVPDLFRL